MGLIPNETIAEIRERADIVALIGQHIELKKAGRNFKGLCPFHDEKTPSFSVNADKGYYYCFGCQQKGDIFSFIMEYEGKSFVEAASGLAEQLGIVIPEDAEREVGTNYRNEKSEMLELNRLAAKFFRDHLQSHGGKRGQEYLRERGIGAEQSEAFQLGFAPPTWSSLADFLSAHEVNMECAERVGLVVKQKRGDGYYDRFRNRLMCPIMQTSGEVVGFSGRLLPSDDPSNNAESGAKYINSPESLIYKKSKLLFALFQAREAFRTCGHGILVEGNFDVIRLHEHGFKQTVAPLGTALTPEQGLRLRRLTKQIILLYDGDRAGRAATLKGLQTLLAQELSVKIATLPPGEDPDSLIERKGPKALAEVLERAQPAVEYFIHEIWSGGDRSDEGRAQSLQEAAHVLRSIKDPTRRDLAVGTFASALGIDETTLRRGLRRALQEPQRLERGDTSVDAERKTTPRTSAPVSHMPPKLQMDTICILAEFPELLQVAEEGDVFSHLTDVRLKEMYLAAREGNPMLSVTDDPNIAGAVLARSFCDVPNPTNALKDSIEQLRRVALRRQLSSLQMQAEEAERRGDSERARQLIREILANRKQVN